MGDLDDDHCVSLASLGQLVTVPSRILDISSSLVWQWRQRAVVGKACVPEPDHVTPAAAVSNHALTSRASSGQEISSYLWPHGSMGSGGSGRLADRGRLINRCGQKELPSPQKLAIAAVCPYTARPVDAAAGWRARCDCGSAGAEETGVKLWTRPTILPAQGLSRQLVLIGLECRCNKKAKVWGSLRMGSIDLSLTPTNLRSTRSAVPPHPKCKRCAAEAAYLIARREQLDHLD